MHEKIIKYSITCGAGVVMLVAGMVTGVWIMRKGVASNTNNTTYQEGWDAAKKRLMETGFYSMTAVGDVKNVSGIVQSVRSGGITVKIRPIEPLADPSLDVRTVTFDANTKFYLIKQKDPVVYQKEMTEFSRAMQRMSAQPGKLTPMSTSTLMIAPPQPFDQIAATAADIKEGQQISVVAASNIRDAKEFVAMEVTVQEAVAQGGAPAGIASPPPPAAAAPIMPVQ